MKPIRKSAMLIAYACLVLLHGSCVREDTEDCLQYAVNVRAVDAEGNDLTESGTLEKTVVYLFNEKGFVRMVPAGISSDFLFGHDRNGRLTLVAWGNLKEDTLVTTEISPGTSLEQARLQLRQHAGGSHLPLTDLFYCRKELNKEATTRGMQEETVTLVMERTAAGLSIRTRYLAERYPYNGKPYTFIVRGTGTEVDFTGRIKGGDAGYRPASHTDGQGDVYAPPFRIFPTREDERIEIDIYRERERICTITQTNDSIPLRASAGRQTNIDIDFRYAKVKTHVTVAPWGTVDQDTEM